MPCSHLHRLLPPDTSLQVELFVGGDDHRRHKKALSQGVDIVVGTTGRLGGCLDDKSLDLSHVKFFVLDEADRLVDGENLQKVLQLYAACPSGGTGDNRLQVRTNQPKKGDGMHPIHIIAPPPLLLKKGVLLLGHVAFAGDHVLGVQALRQPHLGRPQRCGCACTRMHAPPTSPLLSHPLCAPPRPVV